MNIGILGAGSIGSILARKLSSAGHNVKIANSRGPHTIDPSIVAAGARAVEASDVITDIEVLIISVPLSSVPAVKALIADLPDEVAVIDTSNYYPLRDGRRGGFNVTVTKADGSSLNQFGEAGTRSR